MRRIRIACGVLLGVMVLALAAKTVQVQAARTVESQVQEKRPQLSSAMTLKVINSLHPIRDGMNLVSIDADGVKVWANVKKADWAATDWVVDQSDKMPRPYALLIPIGQPGSTQAEGAKKGGKQGPTPTPPTTPPTTPSPSPSPTPDKCYNVETGSDGNLKLGAETPCKKK